MTQGIRQMVFVLSLGRTGTSFLADLLDRDPRARIRHEGWRSDRHILGLSRYGHSSRVVEALLEERFAALVPQDPSVEIYGEVNSYLRYNAHWLRRHLDPVLVHVVRDGRDFVRSAVARDVQTPEQLELPIVPDDGDPIAEQWGGMSRFERICWIWTHTNEMLAGAVPGHTRLEDLLSSYEAFRGALLEPTGLEVSEATWSEAVRSPQNTSTQFRIGRRLRGLVRPGRAAPAETISHWSEWPDSLTASFWRLCGSAMERFGYGREGVPAAEARAGGVTPPPKQPPTSPDAG